jgi:AbrB family looped-hinge helix DNA binding protein
MDAQNICWGALLIGAIGSALFLGVVQPVAQANCPGAGSRSTSAPLPGLHLSSFLCATGCTSLWSSPGAPSLPFFQSIRLAAFLAICRASFVSYTYGIHRRLGFSGTFFGPGPPECRPLAGNVTNWWPRGNSEVLIRLLIGYDVGLTCSCLRRADCPRTEWTIERRVRSGPRPYQSHIERSPGSGRHECRPRHGHLSEGPPRPVQVAQTYAYEACGISNHAKSQEEHAKVRTRSAKVQKQARITSKGQITVPRDIRNTLGVGPGDRLVFESDSRGVRIRAVRAESPFEKYRGIGNPGIPPGRKAVRRWVRQLRGQ